MVQAKKTREKSLFWSLMVAAPMDNPLHTPGATGCGESEVTPDAPNCSGCTTQPNQVAQDTVPAHGEREGTPSAPPGLSHEAYGTATDRVTRSVAPARPLHFLSRSFGRHLGRGAGASSGTRESAR